MPITYFFVMTFCQNSSLIFVVSGRQYIVHRAQLEIKRRLGTLHALFIGAFKGSAINTKLTKNLLDYIKLLSKNVHFYACALLFSKSEVMLLQVLHRVSSLYEFCDCGAINCVPLLGKLRAEQQEGREVFFTLPV